MQLAQLLKNDKRENQHEHRQQRDDDGVRFERLALAFDDADFLPFYQRRDVADFHLPLPGLVESGFLLGFLDEGVGVFQVALPVAVVREAQNGNGFLGGRLHVGNGRHQQQLEGPFLLAGQLVDVGRGAGAHGQLVQREVR